MSKDVRDRVTNSQPGRDGTTANSTTCCTGPTEAATKPATFSGLAGSTTGSDTPGPSSPLSDDERWKLARVRRNRRFGWMPTMEECDFLLELLGKLGL